MMNIDPGLYVRRAVFEAEREAVFSTTWQLLGPAAKLKARRSYVAVEIAGMKVFAVRSNDGVLRAFRNVCRHRGARLLPEGEGTCGPIRCPYHQWQYSDAGVLLQAPWYGTEPGFDMADWPLEPVAVEEWRGLVFVAIRPAVGLLEQLGDTVAELVLEPIESYAPVRTERMVFEANWKIYTDNFVEGLHIPGIHPAFHAAIDFDAFETTAHDGLVRMTAPPKDGLFYRGKWLWMWPNWTLSLFGGGINTSWINPLDEGRTELIYDFYFADGLDAEARERSVQGTLGVVREDFGVCVQTQANYASGGYRPGPLSARHETGVAYFQGRVMAALESKA
ncbi:MAG: aromatic ring-hydroxylating dioxygenase subunit alpha [Candidatus Saccharibacteria bacterium]|nr:aromatic ring-hydroxylating dioxygenase subunit alpha [Pseudorhodobacter sp.]